MFVPVPIASRSRPKIGLLPLVCLTAAVIAGLLVLLVAATALAVSWTPELGGTSRLVLFALAILATVGLPVLLGIGAALSRGRMRLARVLIGVAAANYVAWLVLVAAST